MKQDIIDLFQNDDEIKKIDETYNGEYSDMLVKKTYEIYPKVSYPMTTLQEISNDPVDRFWDGDKDNVVYLAYQIGINAIQSENYTAYENVERIANIIDGYMKQDRYKCLKRFGNLPIIPLRTDQNVMTGYLRYECHLDLNTNTIYRRS